MTHPMLFGPVPYVPTPPRGPIPGVASKSISLLHRETYLSLDLGQLVDPSATAAVERSLILDPVLQPDGSIVEVPRRTSRGQLIRKFDVVGLKRHDLGTSYPSIVEHTREKLRQLPGAKVLVDASGVGRAVIDMFRDLRVDVSAITITGGDSWSNPTYGEYRVSKSELVGAGRRALETEMLKVAPNVSYRDMLRKELMNFRVHVSKAANEIYSAREGDHDDLCISIFLPVWFSWMLDQTQQFISGVHKVDVAKPRNPMKITADVSGLFGRRGQLSLPGGSSASSNSGMGGNRENRGGDGGSGIFGAP